MFYRRLRDLMEHDTIDFRCIDTKRLTEMPSYRLSFTILVGRYPYFICVFGVFFEFCDSFLLLWRDLILRNESARDIYTEVFGWEVTYMTK